MERLNSVPRKGRFGPMIQVVLFQLMSWALLFVYLYPDMWKERWQDLALAAALLVAFFISNLILVKVLRGETFIFQIVEMLTSIGIVMIYRLNRVQGLKQMIWVILSLFVFFATYAVFLYFRKWNRLIPLYILGIYGLYGLTFAFSTRKYGALNWIRINDYISFQPSEIIKILMILLLASYYSRKSQDIKEERLWNRWMNKPYSSYILTLMLWSFVLLLFLQRDLGMAAVFFSIFFAIQFIYEKDPKIFYGNLLIALTGAIGGFKFFNHVRIRVQVWLDPLKYVDSKGYQMTQSLIAISEGGLFGRGIGLGSPKSIPKVSTDFIFSGICEEMGIFVGIAIIMLFMLTVYRGFKIALSQDDLFLRIVALASSTAMGVQTFLILGGITKLIPMTGITLPFVSYGGSSMLTNFILIALITVSSIESKGGIRYEE